MGSSGPGGFFFDVLAFTIALTGNNYLQYASFIADKLGTKLNGIFAWQELQRPVTYTYLSYNGL